MHVYIKCLCAYVDWEAPLSYFKAWIMKFHQNWEMLTNSLVGPAPGLQVEATARAYNRWHNVLLMNKIPV